LLAGIARIAQGPSFGGEDEVWVSTERIYVEASIYDEFVDRVVSNVRALRLGVDGPDLGAELGAMTSTAQVDTVMCR